MEVRESYEINDALAVLARIRREIERPHDAAGGDKRTAAAAGGGVKRTITEPKAQLVDDGTELIMLYAYTACKDLLSLYFDSSTHTLISEYADLERQFNTQRAMDQHLEYSPGQCPLNL